MAHRALALHVGMHKTGSSAIQKYLFERREQLGGARYIHSGRPNSSLWLLQAFKQDYIHLPSNVHRDVTPEKAARVRARARRELEQTLAENTANLAILSGEAVSLFKPGEMADLQEFLSRFFDTVTVYQYVRPLRSKLESGFQEKLKRRLVSLEDELIPNYWKRTRLLDEAFGRDQVQVLKYDPAGFPKADVVLHFLQQLDVPPPDARAEQSVNSGLSLAAVQLLYVYRLQNPNFSPGDRAIIQRLSSLKGQAFKFHSELYQRVVKVDSNWVTRFEQRAGFSILSEENATDGSGVSSDAELTDIPRSSIDWLMQQTGGIGRARLQDPCSLEAIAKHVSDLADSPAQ